MQRTEKVALKQVWRNVNVIDMYVNKAICNDWEGGGWHVGAAEPETIYH